MLVQIGESWVEADDVVMVATAPKDETNPNGEQMTKIFLRWDRLWLKTTVSPADAAAAVNAGKNQGRE